MKKYLLLFVCSMMISFLNGQSCITCTSTNSTLNTGLVMCLPFTAAAINDQSTNAFAGTAMNTPTTLTDRLGNAAGAYKFNGTNQYLRYGDILDDVFAASPEAKFSVSGWINVTAFPSMGNIGVVIGKSAGSTGPYQWYVYLQSSGKLNAAACSSPTGPSNYVVKESGFITPNSWVHFVMVFDGSQTVVSKRVQLYTNTVTGVLSSSNGTLGPTTTNTAQHITIGASHVSGIPTTPGNAYNGSVDDIRIYNRALTTAEINELYNGTPLPITPMPDVGVCMGDSVQLTSSGGTTYNWFPSTNLSSASIANPYCKPTANRTYYVTISSGLCTNRDTVNVTLNPHCCVLANSINSNNGSLVLHVPVTNSVKDASVFPAVTNISGSTSSFASDRYTNKNSAVEFSHQANDKITVAAASKLSFPSGNAFTLSAWTKIKASRSTASNILTVYQNGGYSLMLAPGSPVTDSLKIQYLDYDGSTSSNKVLLTSDSAINLNRWYLVTVTVNKSDSMIRLYLNGRLAAVTKSASTVQSNCGAIIGNHNSTASGLDGFVDDIRIYTKELTQAEIIDLYYNGKPTILNPDTTICSGDSVQLSVSGNASSYSWSPATGLSDPTIPNPVAKPLTTTSYFLTTVNGGCTFLDTLVIYVNYASANAGSDTTLCKGDSVRLNGSGGTSYTWAPAYRISDSGIRDPYVSPDSDTSYVLTVQTASCVSTDTVRVFVNHVVADAGMDQTICPGDSIQLHGSGGDSYLWTPASTLSSDTAASPYAKPVTPVTYYLTATRGFCSKTDSVHIGIVSITPDAGTDQQICPGDNIQLNATGGTSYAWMDNGYISDTTSATPVVTPPATTTFYVRVYQGVCYAIDSVRITVSSTLTTTASNDTAVCKGSPAQLNATGGSTFTWTPVTGLSDANSSSPVATPTSTTSYVVQGQSGNCIAYDTVIVTVNNLPVVNAGNDTSGCKYEPFLLTPTITDANTYQWSPAAFLDNPTSPYPNATIDTRTEFTLVATNSLTGCSSSDNIWLDVSVPVALFTLNPQTGDAPLTVQTSNSSTPQPMTYLWQFADSADYYSAESTPAYTFENPGTFLVILTATDQFGCSASDTTSVSVNDVVTVSVPNAFTPNGDKRNEVFELFYDPAVISKLEGTIWNRWGMKVYEFVIPGGAWWDGKVNGEFAAEGVYSYEVKVTDTNQRVKYQRGNITLFR